MPNDETIPSDFPPPGRYGSVTVFAAFEPTNVSPEEATWEVVTPRAMRNVVLIEGPKLAIVPAATKQTNDAVPFDEQTSPRRQVI